MNVKVHRKGSCTCQRKRQVHHSLKVRSYPCKRSGTRGSCCEGRVLRCNSIGLKAIFNKEWDQVLTLHVTLHIQLRHLFGDHSWRDKEGLEAEWERSWSSSVTRRFREVISVTEKLKILWTVKERWENLCLDKRSRKEDQWGLWSDVRGTGSNAKE